MRRRRRWCCCTRSVWTARTSTIPTPTLIIAGGPDSHTPQDRLTQVGDRIPDCTPVTIPTGHHVHADRPAEFITAVRQFLSSERP